MTITMSNTFIFLALLAMVLPWHAECIGSPDKGSKGSKLLKGLKGLKGLTGSKKGSGMGSRRRSVSTGDLPKASTASSSGMSTGDLTDLEDFEMTKAELKNQVAKLEQQVAGGAAELGQRLDLTDELARADNLAQTSNLFAKTKPKPTPTPEPFRNYGRPSDLEEDDLKNLMATLKLVEGKDLDQDQRQYVENRAKLLARRRSSSNRSRSSSNRSSSNRSRSSSNEGV